MAILKSLNNNKAHILWALLLVNIYANAQKNLVPNYSFENFTQCLPGSISIATPWTTSSNTGTQCEYCNSCISSNCCSVPFNTFGNSYQYAHTGNADSCQYFMDQYGGDLRGYLQTKLIDSLRAGNCDLPS